MAKTLRRLCLGSVLVAAMSIACGKTEDDGKGAEGGKPGSDGGSIGSDGGSIGNGGSGSASRGGSTTATNGGTSGSAAGGQPAAGRSPDSGGSSTIKGGTGGTTDGGRTNGGNPPGGSGGRSSGGSSSAGASNGGASGGEDSAGAGGLGGAGGATQCPAIKCAAVCAEYWLGLDGCPTCACAPPAVKLTLGSVSCPSESLTVTSSSSIYIGGYNRWVLDFEWACSHSGLLGEPERAKLQVGVIQPVNPPVDEHNRTFLFPKGAQDPLQYELRQATIWMRGSGVPEVEIPLTGSSSFLSVRIENGKLVGGVEYVGTNSMKTTTATLAGPFSVAVPTTN